MPKFDYAEIQRSLRSGNIPKFRESALYGRVPLEEAQAIVRRYIEGEISLQEYTILIDSLQRHN
jgi:hypothetical protein